MRAYLEGARRRTNSAPLTRPRRQSRLPFQEECPGISAFAAELEASEVLVPRAVRNLRSMSSPFFKGEDILHGDVSLFGAIKEMLTGRDGQI